MMAPEAYLILLCERLLCLALILQSIELLIVMPNFSETGIWRWSQIKKEYPNWLQKILSLGLDFPNFKILQYLRIILAGVVLYSPHSPALLALLIISLLTCLRFRGNFNGGSDYMTMSILLPLSIHSIFPDLSIVCLYFIAIQAIESFFIAGIVKAKNSDWWSGKALKEFTHGKFKWAPLAWAVILFELSFPVIILSPKLGLLYIALAFVFQISIFLTLGLNRFVFAWAAAYPAVYFLSLNFSDLFFR